MSDGASKLSYAVKNLRRKWDEIESHWKDAVRDDFESRHINPMINQVTVTSRAMGTLEEVIQKMRRDCS
jgi:hypothetical protein